MNESISRIPHFEPRPEEFYTPIPFRHYSYVMGPMHAARNERHECKLCLSLSFYWF